MFGLVSKKEYDILVEQNNMLSREISHYQHIIHESGFWYIQNYHENLYRCSNCNSELTFTLDSIPAKCPICEKHMYALKNDPRRIPKNPEVEELKKENEKLKLQISSMQVDINGLEDSNRHYRDKYLDICDVMREINNTISDENDQIPNKCPDCGGNIFYNCIGHYGMCIKCGKNYKMSKMWETLNLKKPEVPCNKCKYKNNTEEK